MTSAERLSRVELELARLNRALLSAAELDEARKRFGTSGPTAVPMTCRQVGQVLGIKPGSVCAWVARGVLVRRWPGVFACFHPDDVRAALELCGRIEAEREAVLSAD